MATKKEKEIIMKTRKPGLPVNISTYVEIY